MEDDPNINPPGVGSDLSNPSQTPSERLYLANGEYLPWGAVIPGMGGTRVGDEIVDDAGNRWNWEIDDWDYAGSKTEGEKTDTQPTDSSPFPTVNYLQDPTALLMNPSGEPAAPSGPRFTPQAAPPAVRLDQPQTIFGPVTPSGYAIQPVDPMSYYSKPSTQPGYQEQDYGILPDSWKKEYIETGRGPLITPETTRPSEPPITSGPPQTGGEPVVTPPRESIVLPSEAVTTVPVQKIPAVTEQQQLFPEVVTINRPTFPIYEPPPSRGPVTIPGTAVSSRPVLQPVEPIAQVAPTTVPVPTRQDMSFSPGRFDYINYDPEEILAAAMRAMGNSRIRQSITDEAVQNRMFSRMR